MTNFPRVDIYSHTNYRSYFQSLGEVWIEKHGSWRELSLVCGFASPNFVQQMIAGRRNLTMAAGLKFCNRVGLNSVESQYLKCLIRRSRAKDAKEIESILLEMKRLVGRSRKQSIKDNSIFDSWLYGVVFEAFKLKHCKNVDDLMTLHSRMNATPSQIKHAFEFLNSKGYLVKRKNRWVAAELEFIPQNDARRINSQNNHLKFFTLAQHRLNDELTEREYQGLTLAIKESRFPELKKAIREFIGVVNEFAEDEGADQVVRLQLGLFNVLK